MTKDIAKYLYNRDSADVELSYLEDFDGISDHLKTCVELGLGISGMVNKLNSFISALAFYKLESPTMEKLKTLRREKCTEKVATFKRKRNPTRLVEYICLFTNRYIFHLIQRT